jgi:Domain of unknown function (DUF4407)
MCAYRSHENETRLTTVNVVVLLNAVVAWLAAALAVAASTTWPLLAILPLTLIFGVLVAAVTRAIASGPTRGWLSIAARAAVAVAVGIVVGEFASLVIFSGSIDQLLQEYAARDAASTPAVAQASADLDQARRARAALDDAVGNARAHRDEALVVARCEYHPTPACPQTRITGVPGTGPETRTANQLLADTQRELDDALAARDRRAPGLDAQIADREQALARAREAAVATTDRGLGTRWVALQQLTFASAGAIVLRALTTAFFALLSLLPLILRLWRGETTHERHAAARAERDRAELEADTAIAVKRAEVRAAAEILWAEQQLANARLAVEAQAEIDRAQQQRRVTEALDGSAHAELPAVEQDTDTDTDVAEPENLPARAHNPLIPTIPDVTKAAARWIRPLVPPIVARAVETSTQPLRAARQVLEEVEEIHFSLRRTRKVTIASEHDPEPEQLGSAATDTAVKPRRVDSVRAAERAPQELADHDEPRQLPPTE